ncbi:tRNA (N6-threonylcarbamoyladenosine(37)-N6)-methyltransferase TrmO [Fusobacterium sp.]|uniref:tRNA (N6-threonylcarbamoyladenosine(37)-N6)-methyltransferase TrmO n=1 Tax=Fusobacterium sp. TaxID=68766 RepID=UPI0025BEDE14|nr:tRNA (N6-threonylcarbamoyladenosine(37)-N6)-methyltransferase TrmO [Fusobacterium sp.]MCI5725901.1 tRNA (N6-threonylcarbamoyladenosine(37)-N6)-methyltransferase TrmO [Fusobacterium sp.]
MQLKEIGRIFNNFKDERETPRQGKFSSEKSTIKILPEYRDVLKGLEEVEFILVFYWGNKVDRENLKIEANFNNKNIKRNTEKGCRNLVEGKEYGVFSIRTLNRPNPIGLCVCKIISIEKDKIEVIGLDAYDNTVLLDIKPYIKEIDNDIF